MKLSTKKIFDSYIKVNNKSKNIDTFKSNKHKKSSKLVNARFNLNKENILNSNLKKTLFQKSSTNVKPYNQKSKPKIGLKYISLFKISDPKIIRPKFDSLEKKDLFEDSDKNYDEKTNDTNNNQKIINKENESNKNFWELEKLCDSFKKSSLKSTIIIDIRGNNNLDSEQKNIINNYFNKNVKISKNCKDKKFEYSKKNRYGMFLNRNNNVLFNSINLKSNTINVNVNEHKNSCRPSIINKINNKRSKDELKFKNNYIKIKENLFDDKKPNIRNSVKIPSTKNNRVNFFQDFIKNNDKLIIEKKNKKNKEEIEKNSLFENTTNNSIDSSFLGSSLEDNFFLNLNIN